MKTRIFLIALSLITATTVFTGCGNSNKLEDLAGAPVSGEVENAISAGDEAKHDTADKDSADVEAVIEHDRSEEALLEEAISVDKAVADVDIKEGPDIEPSIIVDDANPFILTAGEWNDNNNWGFFSNLVNNQTINFPSYGLDPTHRIKVTVENDGSPVRYNHVNLMSGDDTIWTSVTDKDGVAYLFWDGVTSGNYNIVTEGTAAPYSISLQGDNNTEQGSHKDNSEVSIDVDVSRDNFTKTQVMFILDTTGSMGDEITFLQKDFSSIAEETAKDGITYSVNFYRDEGDDYVTKCNPFTNDIKTIQQRLNDEYADGGGDAPEAVDKILEDTMLKADWDEEANKIAFLIFDAPPHEDTEQTIIDTIKHASAHDIHIVPVVASNADRNTELFGRAISIMTNSNYVFLTDDSGVGDSHLEPIVGDYDVELLHDIIVRNINAIQ